VVALGLLLAGGFRGEAQDRGTREGRAQAALLASPRSSLISPAVR